MSQLPNISKKELEKVVSQLFEGDMENIPENFSDIDPASFGKEIIKQKKKLGYNSKINLPVNYLLEQAEKVVTKINESRLVLTGEQFETILSSIEMGADVSVWGSDTWSPKVLPNGSVLIRNHHRVIALSERVSGQIDITNQELQEQLKEVYAYAQDNIESDDTTSFNFLHRSEEGISWTNKLPESFSDYGQTLIFISKDFIEQAQDFISGDNIVFTDSISNVADESRSGHCVLRVFKNKTFLYSTYRASDEYDTILENFSYYLGSQPDEDICEQPVSSKSEFISNYIKDTLKENDEEELFTTKVLKTNKTLKLLLEDKFYNDFSMKKTWQIMSFEPFFAKDWDKPTTYCEDYIPYWDLTKHYNGNLIAIKANMNFLSEVSNGEVEFKEKIKNSIAHIPNSLVKLHLPLSQISNQLQYIDEDDIFEYGTRECHNRIHEIFTLLNQKYQQDKASNSEDYTEKDFLDYVGYEFEFSLLFITNESPEPFDFNQYGLDVSNELSSITVIVPTYGFNQGYCDGELDTGNAHQFLIEEENSDDDEYDESED